MTDPTESEIQKAVLQFLSVSRIFHYRNNSGAYLAEHGSYIRYGLPGSPDIIAVINGKYIGLEIKRRKGKQDPDQVEFQRVLEKAGGEYYIVRSVDDVVSIIKQAR